MQRLPLKQKVARCLPFLQRAGLVSDPPPCDVGPKLARIIEATGDRIKVAGDVLAYSDFFFNDAYPFDADAVDKRLRKPGQAELLTKFKTVLSTVEPFDVATLEKAMHDFLAAENIKIGDIVHTLRVAITGKAVGPGIYDCLELLGRDKCLARIDRALAEV